MTMYGLLWAAGGNDIIAIKLHLSINQITYFMRVAVFVGPVIAFIITRRWCISLQRKDQDDLLHGYETGIIMRVARGRLHRAAPAAARGRAPTRSPRATATEVRRARGRRRRATVWPRSGTGTAQLRARLSQWWYADNVQKPTVAELEEAHHHAEHEDEHDAPPGRPRRRRPPVRRPDDVVEGDDLAHHRD